MTVLHAPQKNYWSSSLLFISFLLHFFFAFHLFPINFDYNLSCLLLLFVQCICFLWLLLRLSFCHLFFFQFEFDMNCYGLLDSSCMWGLMKFLCIVVYSSQYLGNFSRSISLKKIFNSSFLMITPVTCWVVSQAFLVFCGFFFPLGF